MILAAFRGNHHNRNIQSLYGAIVAQARSPIFYTLYGVPDTVDGRFELIVLHLVLFVRRLNAAVPGRVRTPANVAGQELFDVFCADLDDNLREMGVGDMAVPRRMRQFAEAYYGRQAAYGAALATPEPDALEKAFARNILGTADIDDRAARLARYAHAAVRQLDAATDEALLVGKSASALFPDPEVSAYA
jgi:cytochrome b pre-mRNA-processing protein 3